MSKNNFIILLAVILFNFIGINEISSAGYNSKSAQNEISKIFLKFENGMNTGAVKEFSLFFDTETYISLENGVSSYFSQNQSYYVLKEFLSNYKPIRFKFIRISDSEDQPFAVGQFTYSLNGMRSTSQVFVSLKKNGTAWKISQITIN
ncbi:MAG: DUF4783 domain-containing protein [Chlorobi bacterium]|nr:DUF4783 domain-containing protein [Chlorobiota bacterium]